VYKRQLSSHPGNSGPGSVQIFLKKNEAALYKEHYKYVRSNFFPTLNIIGSIANQFMAVDTNGLATHLLSPVATIDNIQRTGALIDKYNPDPLDYFNPSFFNYSLGLQLSWTLFDGNSTRARFHIAKCKAKQALLELDMLEKNDAIAIEEAQNQITTADSMITAVTLQTEASRRALEQTSQDYNDGVTDFSTLLETDKEYRDAERFLNGLKIQRILALAQLRIVLGLPVNGERK
jgi:outer membrane protein TolC